MTTRTRNARGAGIELPFRDGERLDQPAFHRLYAPLPPDVKAELIEGVVHVAPAVGFRRASLHAAAVAWLGIYQVATPGVRAADNATVILGPESEPQPDACMLRDGGPARVNDDGYIEGPPPLVVEIADSSADRDLGAKQRDYERAGVSEYLVLVVADSDVRWFVRDEPGQPFRRLAADDEGVLRSPGFSGLWLDTAALFGGDGAKLLATLQTGIAARG